MKSGPILYFDFRTIYHIILNNCVIPWLNSTTEHYKSHGHDMISILMLKMRDVSVPERKRNQNPTALLKTHYITGAFL